MRPTKIQLMDLNTKCREKPGGSALNTIVEHLLHSTSGPNKWPTFKEGDFQAMKAIRVHLSTLTAHDAMMKIAAVAIEISCIETAPIALWLTLPESVHDVFRTGHLTVEDIWAGDKTDKFDVASALWNVLAFHATKMRIASEQCDVLESVRISKHEYFPCLRAIVDLGVTPDHHPETQEEAHSEAK